VLSAAVVPTVLALNRRRGAAVPPLVTTSFHRLRHPLPPLALPQLAGPFLYPQLQFVVRFLQSLLRLAQFGDVDPEFQNPRRTAGFVKRIVMNLVHSPGKSLPFLDVRLTVAKDLAQTAFLAPFTATAKNLKTLPAFGLAKKPAEGLIGKLDRAVRSQKTNKPGYVVQESIESRPFGLEKFEGCGIETGLALGGRALVQSAAHTVNRRWYLGRGGPSELSSGSIRTGVRLLPISCHSLCEFQ